MQLNNKGLNNTNNPSNSSNSKTDLWQSDYKDAMLSKLNISKKNKNYICKFNDDNKVKKYQKEQYQKCKEDDCDTCLHYNNDFIHGYGKYVYETVNQNNNIIINCESKNLVYQIYCIKCNVSYVGETQRELKTRFDEHLYSIRRNILDTLLVQHFNNVHSISDVRIRVIHKLSDSCDKANRINAENFWIHQLITIFPFGLNNKVKGFQGLASEMKEISDSNLKHFFSNPLPVNKKKKKSKNNKAPNRTIPSNPSTNIAEHDEIRKLPSLYSSWKKSQMDGISTNIQNSNSVLIRLASIILSKIKKSRGKENISEKKPIYIQVEFFNNALEKLGLRNIIYDSKIERILNIKKSGYKIVTTFILPKNNFVRFTNYNNILRILDKETLTNCLKNSCNCNLSNFQDVTLNHIVTGDINVISCPKMAAQFLNGAKYRQNCFIDINKFRGILYKYGTDIINKFAAKIKDNTIQLIRDEVTSRLIEIGEQRWKKEIKTDKIIPDNYIGRLKNIDNNFIITNVDKASNNFAFICRKYYLSVIAKELGIDTKDYKIVGNETYKKSDLNQTDILNMYMKFYMSMKMDIDLKCIKVPLIFAIPKFHKNPIKFRFIAGAKSAISKTLNIYTMKILEVVKNNFYNCGNVTKNRSGVNMYWSINNSSQVTSVLSGKYKNKKPTQLFSGDFSNLFTALPHQEIINSIMFLVKYTFTANGSVQIQCNKYRSFFSSKIYQGYNSYTLYEISLIIEFLIKNSFVKFAGINFQQINGIPQGGNASPIIADLTLMAMEYKYIKSCETVKLKQEFSMSFRYIDDILSFNDKFQYKIKDIYGTTLELNRTDQITHTAFLDLNISTSGNGVEYSTYDKTRDYNFGVLKYPKYHSCHPKNIIGNILLTEIIRFSRTNNTKIGLKTNIELLFNAFLKNGCPEAFIRGSINRIIKNKRSILDYINIDTINILLSFRAKFC